MSSVWESNSADVTIWLKLILSLTLLTCSTSTATYINAPTVFVLDSLSLWRVSNPNASYQASTSVPGYALEALRQAGVVADPLFRFGELELRWVAYTHWQFYRDFSLSDDQLVTSHDQVDLILEGVDTIANVQLNNFSTSLLHTNYHRPHRISSVKGFLLANNTINITIHPALPAATAAKERYPYEIPTFLGPGMLGTWQFLRKPASDSGWDWGPAFSPSGIQASVYLLAYSTAVLRGLHVSQEYMQTLSGAMIRLRLETAFLLPTSPGTGVVIASVPELNISTSAKLAFPSAVAGEHFEWLSLEVDAAAVELWWPRGYGGQRLYNVTVQYCSAQRACPAQRNTTCCDSITRKVGFRQVELVMEPTTEGTGGETFFFRVNGVPVYAKGANVIPMAILATNVSTAYMERLLRGALDANMNMLRVWGGGLYPREQFYNFCDEHGIMLWQEAMMACAPYPRDPSFLEDVTAEIRHQVRRLAAHASVVVFGGNNEVEASLDWFNVTRANRALYAVDYSVLFVDTIRRVLFDLAPQLPFLDGSPTNGLMWRPSPGQYEPYIKRWGDTTDPTRGDVHFYNYAADCQDPNTYPLAKFVSEFGTQSFPPFHTLAAATAPEDWAVESNMTNFRQRHPNGTAQLLAQMGRRFALPASWDAEEAPRRLRLFRTFLYLTQVQQALCYEIALTRWRRGRTAPAGSGNMGILYWQLNDIWQGASWSSIASDLRWKPLHYAVRRAYATLLVSGLVVDGTLQVHVVNDEPTASYRGRLLIHAVHWSISSDDCTVQRGPSAAVPVVAPPGRSTLVFATPLGSLLDAQGCTPNTCYLMLQLASDPSQHAGSFLVPLHSHSDPVVTMVADSSVRVTLQSDAGGPSPDRSMQHRADERRSQRMDRTVGEGGGARGGFGRAKRAGYAGDVATEGYVWLAAFKESQLQPPGIHATDWTQVNASTVSFVAAAEHPAALVVWESRLPGRWSDSLLVLHPCHPVTVEFFSDRDVDVVEVKQSLEISSVVAQLGD